MMAKNTSTEEAVSQPQTPQMTTENEAASPSISPKLVTVKNLDAGTRDYPLLDGSSIYLPMKHKGAVWPKIAEAQISPALRSAERKGHIQFVGD
jgi:hypothetical protein